MAKQSPQGFKVVIVLDYLSSQRAIEHLRAKGCTVCVFDKMLCCIVDDVGRLSNQNNSQDEQVRYTATCYYETAALTWATQLINSVEDGGVLLSASITPF